MASDGQQVRVRAMPVVAFTILDTLVVGTDAGEWFAVDSQRTQIRELPATGPFSAVARDTAGIVVASWEPKLFQLCADAWTEIAIGSPALALATVKRGLVLADVDGGLSLLATNSRMPIQELVAAAPIVELALLGDGLAALGANGSLDVTRWPGEPDSLVPVDTTTIGRVHALFPGILPGTVLVAGTRGVAILNGSRLIAVTTDLPERIRGAAVFQKASCACLHDDGGRAWIVDATLNHAARVRLPDANLVGICAGTQDDSLLAWTADGALHAIHCDGSSFRLVGREVVLAHQGVAIHWTAASGARVTRGHVAWT